MKADTPEGRIGDRTAAEGEIEMGKMGAAEGEDFGGCIGEGTAE